MDAGQPSETDSHGNHRSADRDIFWLFSLLYRIMPIQSNNCKTQTTGLNAPKPSGF